MDPTRERPCGISVQQLADFIVLTFEAEKPGVLQDIDYQVRVNDGTLVYLPFLQTGSGFTLAL